MFDINIHAGADFRLTFYMRDPEGNLIDLTGSVIQAQLKPFPESLQHIDFDVEHNGAGGRCQLSLSKAATEQIDFDKGVYDVMITFPDENRKKVLYGNAKVIPAVTRPVPILPIDMKLEIVPNADALPMPGIMYRIWYCYETGAFCIWDGDAYQVMNTEANWNTMVNKPEEFPPEDHNHDDRYYTEGETDALLADKADTADLGSLAFESSVDYDTEVANKPTLGALADHDTVDYTTELTNTPTLGTMAAIDDAPSDNKEYVRKNGDWSEATGGSGSVDWDDITNKPATFSPSTHSHGDISNGGALTSSVTIANNDRLVITDASDGNKIRAAVNFDGSTTSKALTPKGTFESFAASSHNHDSRYYKESEVDALLLDKADTADLGTMAAVNDAPSDGSEYVRKNGAWAVASGGGGSADWGDIGGDLEDQTDLKDALDAKLESVTPSTDTVGSASAGTAISADDITSWSAGSLGAASYDGDTETLEISFGSLPSLSYTSRSIPNISVTSKTVVTGITTA